MQNDNWMMLSGVIKRLSGNITTLIVSIVVLLTVVSPGFTAEKEGLVHYSHWLYVSNSLIAIVFLVILGALATRNLQKIPGHLQNALEMVVSGLQSFFMGVLGPGGERHAPFLITMFLYILVMNLMGLTGVFQSATATLNMTIALALSAIIYVQIQGILAHGFLGYVKHYMGEPLWLAPLMFPLHIIGELAKPLSLSFRLFGNIFGEKTVIYQITLLGPPLLLGMHVLPVQFPLLIFGLLKSVIQAVVFTVLTAAYLVIMTSHHEDEHGRELEGHPEADAHQAVETATEPEAASSPA